MADNNSFDPTDSLGPEFGKINPQNINPQSLQPFEGDKAAFPDVPEFFNVRPSFNDLDRPDAAVNKVQRDAEFDPNTYRKAIGANFVATVKQPMPKHARMYSYDAGPSSNTFYKRYKAYGDEKFEQVGFSPIRDNEALFNARTSTWDDFSRMMTHSFWPLFKKGFVAGPESLFNAMSGDFGVDLEQARVYAEASAIGQSSKDGFGAFMSNTTMSFAYTAGIITEAIAEEVAGALLAPVTGGASFFAATANNLRKAGKIFSAADATYDGVRAINKTIKGLDDAAEARKFWRSSTGRFINPLENVTDAWGQIRKAEAAGDNITNLAKMYKTAGGFYRDIRNVNMALAEARLEGGFVQDELYQELYDEYWMEYGQAPDNETQKEMMKQAQAAGTNTVWWNTGLIYASNKILLPNLLGPRGGIRKFLQSKTDDILDLKTGKVVFDKAKKEAVKDAKEKVTKETLKKGEFNWVEKNFKNRIASIRKQPLGKTALGFMGYFKANVSEGLQENAQEVIAEYSKAYYKQQFEDPAVINQQFSRGLLSEAIDSQLSAQGFETFMSGFMMGMFAKPLNAALPAMSVGYNKMFDKEAYQKYMDAKKNYGESVAAKLNDLYSNPDKFFNSKLFDYAIQNSADDVIKGSATKERIDGKEEALIQKITTAIETNTLDYFVEHLESMKDLTVEEFEDALGFEKGTGEEYQGRIDQIVSRAKSIERTYNKWKGKYPNPVDLNKYEPNSEEYNKAALLSAAWDMSIRNAVFFNESFEDTVTRMNDIMTSFTNDLNFSKVSSTDLQAVFDLGRMANEADILRTQIEGMEEAQKLRSDTKSKKELADAKAKLEAYENFMTSLDTFMNYFFVESLTADQKAKARKALETDLGREVTEEELMSALEAKYNTYRSEENDVLAKADFEKAFKEYLRSIANLSGDHVFNSNVDEAFDKLIDFYRLDAESRSMAFYANLLSNPQDFRDHVERNYEWMGELYESRKDYYDSMVKTAFDQLEDNALLNALADENIYVSPEDFAEFKKTGQLPEEFYDESRKKVIRQGTPDYDRYAYLFQMKALMDLAAQAQAHPLNKALEKKLAELDKEMQEKIDALPKTEVKGEVTPIKKPKLKKLTLSVVLKELNDKDYVTLTFKKGDETSSVTFYMDGETLKHDNAEGKKVNVDKVTGTFISAEKYQMIMQADPEAVAAIEKEYAEKRAQLIEDFRKDGKTYQEYVPVTMSTPVDQLPAELKAELLKALNEEILQTPGLYEGTEEEMLTAFMESVKAGEILDEYNAKQEAIHAAGQQEVPAAPIIAIDGKQLSSEDMSPDKIEYYIGRYQKEIKKLQNKKKLNDQERMRLSEYKTVLADLSDYLAWRLQTARPEAMQETISKIEQLKLGQDKITKTKNAYWIDGKAYQRVTKSLEGIKEAAYEYADIDKIIAHFEVTLGQGGTVFDFMTLLKQDVALRGFTDISYEYLGPRMEIIAARMNAKATKSEVKAIEAIIKGLEEDLVSAEGEFKVKDPELAVKLREQIQDYEKQIPLKEEDLEEVLKNEINEATYREARIGGSELDAMVRDYFTNLNKEFVWSAEEFGDLISKDAFNELFGPNGVFTALRQEVKNNNLYVNAEGLILYDEKAGIAGEVDLLVVDKEGNVHIVDLKTGTENTWKHFKDYGTQNLQKGQKNSKVEAYELQQLAYKNLLFNMTGLDASINLLPIVRTTETNTGKVLTAKHVASLIPVDGTYWFELTPDQAMQDKVNELIAPAEVTDTIDPAVQEVMDEPVGEDSDQTPEPDVEVIGEVEYPTLEQSVGQTVYFEGKPFRLKKVERKKKTPRYELYSPAKTLYLTDVTGETTLQEAGLNLPQEREAITSKYTVQLNNEKSVTVNDVKYDIVTDKNGNIISLIPLNNPKQRIKNQALIIAVEVERNKTNYQELSENNTEEEPVTIEDFDNALEEDDFFTTSLIRNIYGKNMNDTVAEGLDKLYAAEEIPLTDEERLALDLWVTDAIVDMTKLYNRKPTVQVGRALDELETINILLYTGDYAIQETEAGSDESITEQPTKGATEISPRKKKTETETKQKDVAKEKETPSDMMSLEEVKLKIAKATDIPAIRAELMIAHSQGRISNQTLIQISGLLLEREAELEKGVNIELTFDNIEEGMKLVVKNDIFTGKKVFAEKHQTVMVTQASDGKITVKPLGTVRVKDFTDIEEINNYFTTMEIEKAKEKVAEEPLTQEDKEVIKQSTDTVQVFLQTRMNDSSNEANAETLEQIEDKLFNDLDC